MDDFTVVASLLQSLPLLQRHQNKHITTIQNPLPLIFLHHPPHQSFNQDPFSELVPAHVSLLFLSVLSEQCRLSECPAHCVFSLFLFNKANWGTFSELKSIIILSVLHLSSFLIFFSFMFCLLPTPMSFCLSRIFCLKSGFRANSTHPSTTNSRESFQL